FIADRFSYISFLGLFFIPAYYLDQFIKEEKFNPIIIYFMAFMMLGSYIYISREQNTIWKNSETLWTHVVNLYPNNPIPWGNRASYYKKNKQYELALKDYNQALAIKPDMDIFLNGRAEIYFTLAKDEQYLNLAMQDYNKAIAANNQKGEYYINKGTTYA